MVNRNSSIIELGKGFRLARILEFEVSIGRVKLEELHSNQSIKFTQEHIDRKFKKLHPKYNIEQLEMVHQPLGCRFEWQHHTSKVIEQVVDIVEPIRLGLEHIQRIIVVEQLKLERQVIELDSSIEHMVMAQVRRGIVMLVSHRNRDQLGAIHSTLPKLLGLVGKQQIVELVLTSSSIRHMEMVQVEQRIIMSLVRIHRVKQLVIHTIQCIELLMVDKVRRFELAHRNRHIEHMEMVLVQLRIIMFAH